MDEHGRKEKVITITYAITSSSGEIGKIAEEIALEQTVEVPAEVIGDDRVREEIVGKVVSIHRTDSETEERCIVEIAYPVIVSNYEIPQFLNLLYGNISFKRGIRIVDMHFPPEFIRTFRGPKVGLEGMRRLIGVFDRPLVSTALKPMGRSPEELAEMCYQFALGGIDIIKDDHSLVDFPFCRFEERVTECMKAIERAEAKTGKRALYFPNITGRFERIMNNVEYAMEKNVGGLLVSPFVMGLDCVRHIAERDGIDKPVMSHPSLTGIFFADSETGIAPGLLLGKLFRLIGIDCSVFPNFGGRFSFDRPTCLSIAGALREEFYHMRSAFPTPAGGMRLENIAEILHFYGKDIILLIGGALYLKSRDLQEGARYFCERVSAACRQ
ncbi:MAG TPA: RuBisCO large subunit C-terminal-like domain-containing protein [Thermodesulfovibrionales bacterium]|jgi:ribulose-bisphosphate carboxylase large chain|nr:RuBisCO large subunit C-terminal-like domain-containing protein [Thermodesulfovibrionales bacterium]